VHHTNEQGDEEEDGIDEGPEWARRTKEENKIAGLVDGIGKY
jgi:putative ABC transport system ATP-binding protein